MKKIKVDEDEGDMCRWKR